MILRMNDGRTIINIQTAVAEEGALTIRLIRTDSDTLKALFGDEFATKRMETEEGTVFQNYTILDHITEYTGAIWEVVMFREGSAEDENVQQAVVTLAKMQAKDLNDDQAVEVKYLFDAWDGDGHAYSVGDRVLCNDLLYKVIQAHTSQAAWTPDAAASLFARCDDPGEEWPEWRQPTGSADAYEAGAKVSHSDGHWISEVDANVWEPGVYGWEAAE